MNFTSHHIDAMGLKLHVRERPGSGPVVLMLHGWLDHGHGFDWLSEHLPADFRLFTLDFRGHGQSDPLPPGASHQFTDHVADVEAVKHNFGLEQLHLVGHSLGGSVALAWAAARPNAALTLTLIESLGTAGGEPARAVARLTDFLDELFKPVRRRSYASVEEAAARVAESNSSYSKAAALHMATHGTTAVDGGGVAFSADPRVKRTSGMTFDDEQVLAILKAVRCPVQILAGKHGMSLDDATMEQRLNALRRPPVFTFDGGHHVHLDQPEAVAEVVTRFIRP